MVNRINATDKPMLSMFDSGGGDGASSLLIHTSLYSCYTCKRMTSCIEMQTFFFSFEHFFRFGCDAGIYFRNITFVDVQGKAQTAVISPAQLTRSAKVFIRI